MSTISSEYMTLALDVAIALQSSTSGEDRIESRRILMALSAQLVPETAANIPAVLDPPKEQTAPPPKPAAAAVAPQPPAAPPATAPVAAPPADTPPPPAATAMTVGQLNSALVLEFERLGNREGIDAEMAKIGATSVNDMQPEQYQPLIDAVKALTA